MQALLFYKSIVDNLQQSDPKQAEYLEEEVNILVHKLKFISPDQRPSVLVLSQKDSFQPMVNPQVKDTILVAGGNILTEKFDNPSIILVVQEDKSLYGNMQLILQDEILSRTDAIQSDQIYIIQNQLFGESPESFLADVEACAEIIQPKYFIYGRQGVDWVKFDLT